MVKSSTVYEPDEGVNLERYWIDPGQNVVFEEKGI